ncbi:MAG: ATP-binding cassette domain-containing protein [Desulfobacteraceae bacterium]
MALITLRDISWGLGDAPLIEKASLQIEPGDRICLLGRNGVGKSTLLKILAGRIPPDTGDIWRQQGLSVAVLAQEVPDETEGTVFEVVARGLGDPGRLLADHHRLNAMPTDALTPELSKRQARLQNRMAAQAGWELSRQVDQALSRVGLDPTLDFQTLSAGMKRRALFCRTMARQPDLLLLDEPTNHLDIDTILWMEAYIQRHVKTLLFVSHDRAFARGIANRVMELDRGRLIRYDCDYARYLKRRQADEESETKQIRRFDKKLSQEEAWIRQGIKARRTRNQGRVRALKKMRQAFRERRQDMGQTRMRLQEARRSGKLVIQADSVHYAYNGTPYITDFTALIMRGDKIGLIGPNGVGKSTLLKILLKQIRPDQGRVRHGTQLDVAYFDQLRSQLEEEKTVAETIAQGNDFIIFDGDKRHVISYLQDFLFPPERCRTPVHILSGGEKNRLLLAKLFAKPANILVMDEPTNDLDVETLELLEELLFEYSGTLLLVSHDRAFLNNVVTGTLAFEGDGVIRAYPGGYDDWLDQRPQPEPPADRACADNKSATAKRKPKRPRKLSYNEQRELEALPQQIEALEREQQELFSAASDPEFYKREKADMAAVKNRLSLVADEIAEAYERWEMLEKIVGI